MFSGVSICFHRCQNSRIEFIKIINDVIDAAYKVYNINKTKINGNETATKGTEVVADKSRLKAPLAEIRFCLFPISRQNLGEGNQSWETKHLST